MKAPLLILSWALLAGVASGCADTTVGSIDYRSTGGFTGNGDGSTPLHVDPNGSLTRIRPDGTTQTTMLDPTETAGLYRKVDEAGFATLEPAYNSNAADEFYYHVTVQLDGRPHEVAVSESANPPDGLKLVLDTLREIARRPL